MLKFPIYLMWFIRLFLLFKHTDYEFVRDAIVLLIKPLPSYSEFGFGPILSFCYLYNSVKLAKWNLKILIVEATPKLYLKVYKPRCQLVLLVLKFCLVGNKISVWHSSRSQANSTLTFSLRWSHKSWKKDIFKERDDETVFSDEIFEIAKCV